MKREHIQYAIITCGILAVSFLVWKYILNHGPVQKSTEELRSELATGVTPEIRAAAASTLGHRRDTESMELLLDAMEDADENLRARAGFAVEKVLGANFYFRADDPPKARAETLTQIRDFWKMWDAKLKSGEDELIIKD